MRHVPADFSRANSLPLKWWAGGAGGPWLGSTHESCQRRVGSVSSLHQPAAASETPVQPALGSAPPWHFFPRKHHHAARQSCGPATLSHAKKCCAVTRGARQHDLGDYFAFQRVHQLLFSRKRLLRQPETKQLERFGFQRPRKLRLWGQQTPQNSEMMSAN